MKFYRILLILLFCCLLTPALDASAENRTLYWQDFSVKARLTGDGILHIQEEQHIVFNGNWNGGERQFNLKPGQTFTFNAIYRIGADGNKVPLEKGDLSKTGHYDWVGRDTLRWRSRLPNDPPFQNQTITYRIDYSLGKILQPMGENQYFLNHDFAFSKRSGAIQAFSLELYVDKHWAGVSSPLNVTGKNIPPGKSVIISQELTHDGTTNVHYHKAHKIPRNRHIAIEPAPLWLVIGASVCLVIFLIGCSIVFFRHEHTQGRFKPLLAYDQINETWLQENLLTMLPETVGALWDRKTGGHEVTAVLARMVAEKKMSSYIEPVTIPFLGWKVPGKYILYLELLLPRQTFTGYERELIDGFFIDGDTTDTRRIRKYYRQQSTSFQPVTRIAEPLEKRVEELTRAIKNPVEYRWIFIVAGIFITFFILLANCFVHQNEVTETLFAGFAGLIALIVGSAQAATYRSRSDHLWRRAALIYLFPFFLIIASTMLFLWGISTLLYIGVFILYATAIYSVFYFAKTKDSPEGAALSRNLTSARNYFRAELEKDSPAIRDEWFPYLLAFGLGPHVDSWSKQFGTSTHAGSRSSSSLGSGGASFSGGGGQFGGGGTSGAWATAVSSLSTSSSSSSSSSGGGSSGGGGGGGW